MTSPEWIATYPKTGAITESTVEVIGRINEAGTVYFVVLADGAAAPSAAQVKAGTDASGTAVPADRKGSGTGAANADISFSLTGLTASTNYDVYFVAQDSAVLQNIQAAAVKLDVATIST
jgi:hypothetical protein